ncbi:hypothetical protein AB0B86_16400 [Micromonospora sp. NPDC049047]|uniref:hypothetical protein n=1 Tax=Micromonospora sp. NPDC049047 TaxID=3155645 RepID=UPI0033C34B1C
MNPEQRALVTMVSALVGILFAGGAVWLVAGGGRPTGDDILAAGWIMAALLAAFGAVAICLGKRRRR